MRQKSILSRLWEQRQIQLMVIPGIIFILIFCYLPMYGLIIAFQNFRVGDSLFNLSNVDWVGLQNFRQFVKSPDFYVIIRNTLVISALRLLIIFPAPIILAVLINEIKCLRFKKLFQSISYLPYFISWVIVGGLVTSMLSVDGTINDILSGLGITNSPIMFMGEKKYFWTILIGSDLWKNIGWNTIVFIAAMAAISPELYEAANIDGANRWHRIKYITLPGITPTIAIVLLMTIGSLLSYGFDAIMQLTNNLNNKQLLEVAEVIDTHVLRVGLHMNNYSYATAVGLFRSLISVIMLSLSNFACKKKMGVGLW